MMSLLPTLNALMKPVAWLLTKRLGYGMLLGC